ncbi:MAG: Nif3-like dinuclear metal center hexameric protein [Methanosarcina sp.]|nr:Nif3-like dinuclear metal center hexameric protein [Methanosarcina sp.]
MAISLTELVSELRTIAPRELEEDWDNGGFQINMGQDMMTKILISLEITSEVIKEAVNLGVDCIITHHPLLFHKIDVIDATTITGSYIIQLIGHGISVYSAHTAFDSVFGGNNDYMADLLDLQQVRKLKVWTPMGNRDLSGRMGTFHEERTLAETVKFVEKVLDLKTQVKVVGNPNQMIKTVGLCTGAGGDSIDAAIRNGCDLFITGDISHHEAQKAKEMGLCLIDAGHYGTEHIFAENFASKLRKASEGKVEIFESNIVANPFDSMIY